MIYYFLNIFWFLNTEPVRFYHKRIWVCFFYWNSAIQSLLFLWLAIFCRCFCIHIITVFIDIVQNSLLLLFVHVKKLTLNKYISGKIWQKKIDFNKLKKKLIIHFKSGGDHMHKTAVIYHCNSELPQVQKVCSFQV